ncbi:type II toxin-antitoxin system RelE family toxin [Treponema socranskii]|uniref:Addiction module toxin, RelE/StbE family n=1 Tax=Treponema socranskii subsp. socranskii VPI DR56BR1116 = ATCC 35536 TaxID=1125725 RepID=U1GWA6_TRESO|nr:type II toxin-antitoxin system RelE/ParE family toxin [Treponema socranskii]ERF60859.1 addiction module toxin, RelE/StbE family [Treponema socranskii subsp. socranskii VPI DR56BR1116 = ATCC 35536]ERK02812.1 addiction module toxin, RelE/StbE family [Treponema socranskii subsp. socranskii VPI DR56BR1116 = ATCC 35536]MDR9860265.1 type II toxin-antitoxin system RelE/ParE family toxin [Treponema socranskii]
MKVVLTETFKKQLKKLDAAISKRVLDYLEQIELLDNPRSRGKALTSNLSGLWRYRVGDYRILCRIRDDRLIITVIEIGHRATVYR